jgi:preprotein translocase subunit SecE
MKGYFLPFVGAVIVFSIVFFGLDYSLMKLQGLPLIYTH